MPPHLGDIASGASRLRQRAWLQIAAWEGGWVPGIKQTRGGTRSSCTTSRSARQATPIAARSLAGSLQAMPHSTSCPSSCTDSTSGGTSEGERRGGGEGGSYAVLIPCCNSLHYTLVLIFPALRAPVSTIYRYRHSRRASPATNTQQARVVAWIPPLTDPATPLR